MNEETTFTPIGLSADLVLLNVIKHSSLTTSRNTELNKEVSVSSNDNKQENSQLPGKQLHMFG